MKRTRIAAQLCAFLFEILMATTDQRFEEAFKARAKMQQHLELMLSLIKTNTDLFPDFSLQSDILPRGYEDPGFERLSLTIEWKR